MANVSSRKKSIASNAGLVIDTPVASNSILNKAASQFTSLYQQCASLRSRLMRIPGFPAFFALLHQNGSPTSHPDPVDEIWDCFSLGISLCFLLNLLPSQRTPIGIDTNPATFAIHNTHARKRAIAHFVMGIRQMENCEEFSVTELLDRKSKDGLVKVVRTVTTIVDLLPPETFEPVPLAGLSFTSSPNSSVNGSPCTTVPPDPFIAGCEHAVNELIVTERKYVGDLELMQTYASQLFSHQTLKQDQILLLFPNLKNILEVQRDLLLQFERIILKPFDEQRWDSPFIDNESRFDAYESYCANYTDAVDLMIKLREDLQANTLIDVGSLPALLIKPVQRVCKYPLLLVAIAKAFSDRHPHYKDLQAGVDAAKRIADKVNEAQRREENFKKVQILEKRVKDWKGHHLSNFGNLLLDDIFTVTKSEVDREYHVFLFEKIILCCKEAISTPPGSKKAKNNSLLKKQTTSSPVPATNKEKDTTLLLKGRIFLNNVTQAVPTSPRNSVGSNIITPYSLAVWWRGDDDLEFFTLQCRSEEQLKQWETQINRLIREAATRRASERNLSQIVSHSSHASNSTPFSQRLPLPHSHDRASSSMSYVSYARNTSSIPVSGHHRVTPYCSEMQSYVASSSGSHSSSSVPGYTTSDAFEFDLEDEVEDHPPSASVSSSGRGTPLGIRRVNIESLPLERSFQSSQDRPRARTEDANGHIMEQWKAHKSPLLPPPGAATAITPAYRSMPPHVSQITSAHRYPASGSGARPPGAPPHTHVNSSLLRAPAEHGALRSTTPSPSVGPDSVPMNRSRSASQPGDYVPKSVFHPMPATSTWLHRSQGSLASESKRGSGSSHSTHGSSEDSPNSSPITPFGSSESSLGGSALRPSRSQIFEGLLPNGMHSDLSTPVKVKVHYNEDIFVIIVARCTEFNELVGQMERKIRLCGPRRDDAPLRVKYKDEDGDMISLGCTEDVIMAFESFPPGGQVVLYVT